MRDGVVFVTCIWRLLPPADLPMLILKRLRQLFSIAGGASDLRVAVDRALHVAPGQRPGQLRHPLCDRTLH